MLVNESYSPVAVAAGATVTFTANRVGGFLCTTSGTITVKDGAGNTVVNALAVTAGVFHPIPFILNNNLNGISGGSVVSSSAVGILGVL